MRYQSLDFSQCLYESMPHQVDGTLALVNNPVFALFDEMGVGKTKQEIDADCFLHQMDELDTVVVVAPASVRSVWCDQQIGEIAKHAFIPVRTHEFSSRRAVGWMSNGGDNGLEWIVTNYEFLRSEARLKELKSRLRGKRWKLTLDEATYIKNPRAKQTRAIRELRKTASRVALLTGTPVANSPLDLYSPFHIANPAILGCRSFYQFRARYAKMGGWMNKQVVGFRNLEHLQALLKPYILRRTKEDVLKDLPSKMFTMREVPLSPATWKVYQQMKNDMVVWLDNDKVATAAQAAVRGMRLAQICSGYLGGVEDQDHPEELSCEKLNAAMAWVEEQPRPLEAILWCRFRPELARLVATLGPRDADVFTVRGGQKEAERDAAKHALDAISHSANSRDTILVGNPQAGGMGLNCQRANRVLYISRDHSLTSRLQSEDRCHRKGQTRSVYYTDLVATGPKGERTVDHAIVRALRRKENIARWTTDEWRTALEGN